ncbi:hypothetical protein SteCoe_39390 [Stentor coeruleus]|uniref:Uncharacterized protein n=1 Tax=Stentor coeruleus TaxID=5963 RepID=A0A1R2AKQ9_9CILI|nr:hypothetical protein SteCoe_39390 [Stentor coeruleus]
MKYELQYSFKNVDIFQTYIMNLKCYFENCSNRIDYYCSCKPTYTFICSSHILQHFKEVEPSSHTIKNAYQKYDNKKKQALLNIYGKAIENLSKVQSSIVETLDSLIKAQSEFKKSTEDFFKLQRKEIQSIFDNLFCQENEIIVPELIDNKGFAFEEFAYYNESLIERFSTFGRTNLEFLEKFTGFYKGHLEFNKDNILDFKGNANLNKHLYFFKPGTKTLVKFDVNTLTNSEFEVNVNETQSSLGAACEIPGNKFFHYGGYSPYNKLDKS